MKRIIFILLALVALTAPKASAQQFQINFDFDLYPDYYSHYDDDIYRYGFNINTYAVHFEDRFVTQIHREYGIGRSVIRRYLRRGFSPSDVLFGAELSYRTGHRFQYIMDNYYNSSSRNWIAITVNLGIPFGSPRFGLILNSFDRYYVDWGHYYRVHRPNYRPPMYHHSWSYFRPSPTPQRPPQYNQPHYRSGNNRPPQHNQPNRPPQQPGRQPANNQSSGNRQPAVSPGNQSPSARPSAPGNASPTGNRRGSSTAPAPTGSSNENREARPAPSDRTPANNTGNSNDSRRREPAAQPANNNQSNRSNQTPSRSSNENRNSSVSRSDSNNSSRNSSGSSSSSSSRSSGSSRSSENSSSGSGGRR